MVGSLRYLVGSVRYVVNGLRQLQPGMYQVKAGKYGYTEKLLDIVVNSGETTDLTIALTKN
ncbi:hypothetical protein [Prolixibacter sp. NT017]|uniref:hypothetical protein n=1 Tax=Prolixibacter sp. NT017 TaxID=2652390 RepID=UPI001280D7F0|nr:hypothetical protein [Prolixibacter sp. NT017]GET25437.1 hypothetical protein NT017_17660 [Prolixibacter sp. NT017]